jgi:hypothetical protein
MRTQLATQYRLIAPLLSSACAFILILGWRW